MTDKELMAMALFGLDIVKIHYTQSRHINEAITALKERLAQPEQEPVAWMWDVNNGGGYTSKGIGFMQTNIPFAKHTPLYAHPPQRTEQEPVATVTSETGADITMSWWHEPALPIGTKLYTTPPQRTWVGLTEQEHTDIAVECGCMSADWVFYGAAVERKVKERNT